MPGEYAHTFMHPVAFTLMPGEFHLREKIAAFDYDDTLVRKGTSEGQRAWEWTYESVIDTVRGLHESGYCVMVFTNQQRESKIQQIRESLMEIGVPMLVCIGYNFEHKKPRRVMFELALSQRCGFVFDPEHSFYCGDCMGRPGDRNGVDRKFAENTGLRPVTPEAVFQSPPGSGVSE
jgi:bifunctional polynucleotide phosphatase/kinase